MTGDPKIPPLDVIMGACDDACAYDLGSYSTAILVAAALDAAGYVIVPKEPTFDMMEAALRAGVGRIYMPGGFERDADKYRAMLAASQQKAGQ
jgi:hypothetical protein